MSLLFLDGFDHYATNAQLRMKWTASSDSNIAPTTGSASRWSGGRGVALGTGQWLGYYAPAASGTAWMTVGAAVYRPSGAALSLYIDATSTLPAVRFEILSDGNVLLYRWDTSAYTYISAGTGNGPVTAAAWHYITVASCYTTSGAYGAGYMIVSLDGTEILNITPITTNTSGGVSCTGFRIGSDSGTVYIDDVYATNQRGLNATCDMLPVRVATVFPAGDVANATQFTRVGSGLTGNWQAVMPSAPPTGDWTPYLFGAAEGQNDLYATGNPIPDGKTIYGFVMRWWARASDSTPCGFAPMFNLTGLSPNPYLGPPQLLSASGLYYVTPIYTALPDGSAALAVQNMNALQIGLMASRPTTSANPPQGAQYFHLPVDWLPHLNDPNQWYSVRVTALAPFNGTATDAASDCTSFQIRDTGLAQVAQLLMEVLRTI